jgi:SAM-dependent methyltransferase
MPAEVTVDNINSFFFDGYYKNLWRIVTPDALTDREVDFIYQYFGLQQGSNVLDIMCGYGRHALGLARKGVHLTAVDNLSDYMDELKAKVEAEKLPVNCITSDILNYHDEKTYDLAICMGNSLNFFDENDSLKIMNAVSDALNPGGKFLINTVSLAEIVIKQFVEKNWSWFGEYRMLTDSKYLFNPTRIETEAIIIDKNGNSETKKGIDYIFSFSEMQKMLERSGFVMNEVYSIPGKKKFTLGDPRAYIIAEKK